MNAAEALRRALVAAFASDRIIADIAAVRSTPWASVTFTGVRHELSMRLSGPRADELITGLSERELDLPGHILIDIAATVYDVAGASYPKDATPLEGYSLSPVFRGLPLPVRVLYWEHEGNRAVRQGDWKLVAKHGQPWELYNMAKDRVETNNLAAGEPERVRAMSAMYDAYAKRTNVASWPLK